MTKKEEEWVATTVISLLAITLTLISGYFINNANQSRHSVYYYNFQVVKIEPGYRGYVAQVVGDDRGFCIPLTVSQANEIKLGEIIGFSLDFNGWGTLQGPPTEIQHLGK